MNWLALWQTRKQFSWLGLILLAYAVLVIPTGVHFWHSYQDALANCGHLRTCENIAEQMFTKDWEGNLNPALPLGGFNIVVLLVLAMPFLLGMFVGVPLIAREYIDNTNKLIWTQGVSRRRWLTSKLAWTFLMTVIFAGIFAAFTTWWSKTGNVVYQGKFATVPFDMQGLAPVGYALFAVSLGVALGTWLKRILPAIAVMLAVLLAVQIVVPTYLRPHYKAQSTYTFQMSDDPKGGAMQEPELPHMGAAWKTSSVLINRQGQALDWANPPQACTFTPEQVDSMLKNGSAKGGFVGRQNRKVVSMDCLKKTGYQWRVTYHAANQYWKFQAIESALYVLLAVPFIAFTYWLVLRRDA